MAINYTNADKAKYMTGQYLKEIKLRFPQIGLTLFNDEIYSESLSLEESIFDGNGELSVIGCISNRFSIEIRNQGVSLKNKAIEVQIRIDGGSWNDLFTGYVDSVETVRDRSYQKLQCYDALYQYQDKNFFPKYNTLPSSFTVKTLRDAFFNYLSVSQESTTLVNDAIVLNKNIEDGEIACIDVIRAICQMNGVFGKIDASGTFRYIDLTMPSEFLPYPDDNLFPDDDLYPSKNTGETIYIDKYRNIKYEDYELASITGVTVRDGASDTEYGQAGTSGNMLLIEGNMLCSGLDALTKTSIAGGVLSKAETWVYQPFEATSVGLPFVNCGDAVAYYVYDYSSGEPVTHVMGFSVMSRYLKGIQWMTDTYSARGDEYQPEVIPVDRSGGGNSKEVEQIKQDVSELQTEVSGKQNFINSDLLVPTGSGSTGDLCFYSPNGDGDNRKDLYRYENGHWVEIFPVNVITDAVTPATIGKLRNIVISNYDIGAGAQLDEGTIYLVVD